MASLRQLASFALLALAAGPTALAQPGGDAARNQSDDEASLLWGPYKPNLYFGVRPRLPQSLMAALLWGRADTYSDLHHHVRFTCEQNEGMQGYGWDEYDARRGGTQTIHDTANEIDVTTTFVKVPGGAHGGHWGARIRGVPRAGGAGDALKTMVVLYVAQEEEGAPLVVAGAEEEAEEETDTETETGTDGDVTLVGDSAQLGAFRLVVTKGTGKHPASEHATYGAQRDPGKTVVQSLAVAPEHLWQAKGVLFRQLKETVDHAAAEHGPHNAPPPWQVYQLGHRPGAGNVHLVQKLFEGAFEFEVLFTSGPPASTPPLTSAAVTRAAADAHAAFGVQRAAAFPLAAPYAGDADYERFAASLFSNLLGGVGYFYGHQIVDRSHDAAYDEADEGFWEEAAAARALHRETADGPYALLTAVPSRPFFPRGFLWDEGFHLLPIADWDLDLALEIVQSWFGLMDDDGWIAREQILGAEARSKVPPEFQVQYPHYANPPTLFLVVDGFVDELRAALARGKTGGGRKNKHRHQALLDDPAAGLAYLRALYPRLRRQFDWFRRTQRGDVAAYDRTAFSAREAYRWRGRTESHVLTSGLDDYPRPQPPHPGELHVDLLAWVGLMAKTLANAADVLGLDGGLDDGLDALEAGEAAELAAIRTAVARNLDDLHWSEAEGCYCDATVDAFEEHALVCHRGYVSLFPLLLGLLPADSPRVGRLLALLGDADELFSAHGLRSLSRASPLYGSAENYWRSPVWLNINYLALVQLRALATQAGPFRAQAAGLFGRLRRNLVDTVYASWAETGFAWEQYDPETGRGQRTQHFTGWTSLVVKMMTMEEVGGDVRDEGHVRDEL